MEMTMRRSLLPVAAVLLLSATPALPKEDAPAPKRHVLVELFTSQG
jgi:hypothetical protein